MRRGLDALTFTPEFLGSRASEAASRAWWTEGSPGIYTGRVLTRAWCDALDAAVAAHEADVDVRDAPSNTMHRRGLLIDALGLDELLDELATEWLAPVAQWLFGQHLVGGVSEQHSYVVRYGETYDHDLGFHVDDSEVTLNLCLSASGQGSELYFEGPRCAMHVDSNGRSHERFAWPHEPGVAVLHAGKNRHGVRPILGGVRRNLIVWMRDGGGVERWESDWTHRRCPAWCGAQKT
jgi:hypothetical protein